MLVFNKLLKNDTIKYSVENKKLSDFCVIQSNGKRNSSEGKENGKYPLFYCSILGHLWMDEFDFEDESIIMNTTNGSGKCEIFYCNGKFSVAQSTVRFASNNDNIKTKYVYYYLKNNKNKLEELFKGSNQKQLSRKDLFDFEIPIPSIETQNQIIQQIDTIYATIELNNKAIENNEALKKGCIWSNTLNSKMSKLGDLCKMKAGKLTSQDINNEGTVPFYNGSAFSKDKTDKKSFSGNDYILMIKDGGAGKGKYGNQIGLGKVFFVSGDIACTTSVVAIQEIINVNNKYLYYFLEHIKNNIMDLAQYGVGLGHVSIQKISDIEVPIPSIEIQNLIVQQCESYDLMINMLKEQNKQLESNNIIQNVLSSIGNNETTEFDEEVEDIVQVKEQNDNEQEQSNDVDTISKTSKPKVTKVTKVTKTTTPTTTSKPKVVKVEANRQNGQNESNSTEDEVIGQVHSVEFDKTVPSKTAPSKTAPSKTTQSKTAPSKTIATKQ